ncbi:MAG: 50S ribosomal protein L11 methyltransferase [Kiritimatiellia bacterium]
MQWNIAVTKVWAPIRSDQADAVVEALAGQGFGVSSFEDLEKGGTIAQVFLDAAEDPAPADAALRAALAAQGSAAETHVETLAAQDWAESWKRFFHTARVSPRLVVRPAWEPYEPLPGERVVSIEPGTSFGTGNHATTRACLQMLDQAAAEDADRDVVDAGCGTGILAVAAALLGFRAASGYDNDPDAVAAANALAAAHGVAVPFSLDRLDTYAGQADVMVANILAPVLVENAARLAASVRRGPKAALILSGILDGQYPDVLAAFEAQGFVERCAMQIGEWRSGWLTPRPDDAGSR